VGISPPPDSAACADVGSPPTHPPLRPPVAGRAARPAGVLALLVVILGLLGLMGGPALAQDTSQAIRGTLTDAGEPVEGVVIRVEQDGDEVDEVESNERGVFIIQIPEPGTYTVILDEDSLPDGVALRREGDNEREVSVRAGATVPALFQLGESTRASGTTFNRFLQLLVGGLQFGLVIAMAAIGLSLIFGTTGLTNFAHGEMVTGGAILAYVFNVTWGLNLIPATVLAVAVGGILGGLLDRGLWKPMRRRGTGLIAALVVSIGLALVLRYTYLYFFGGSSRSYAQYATQRPISIGPVNIPPRDLVIMAISIIVLVLVGLALTRTRLGKATRAVADNPSLAASSGIDVERVINVVWAVGSGLAVLGGVFLALSQQVGWLLGFNILLLLFAGVVLGGLGTAFGALVGSVVIGIFTQVSTLVIPAELQNVGALMVLIIILVVRPQGILGRAERVG
jgi:neutral amino acid transport system permease protein